MMFGHRHCGSGDMMVLVCHVILQDHVVKGYCDFMARSPLKASHHLARLVAVGFATVEIRVFSD